MAIIINVLYLQNHQTEGEEGIKAALAKLHEQTQEGFQKLEE